jgi:acetoin utilization deacetylase AcuC-like enzyme
MLTAYYHPGFAAPLGRHIMPIAKFGLVAERLRKMSEVTLTAPQPVTEEDLRRVHSAAYVEAIKTGEPRALAESQKFPWSQQLFRSVCLTNGGCLSAARQALKDGASAALVSGFHHASADHGEGFCTFNGLVVAADALRAAGEVKRVAVLDLDLHYGNGTAQLAASRPYLFQVSIYGNDYWNNTPYRDVDVRQHEDGENHHSFALPAGANLFILAEALTKGLTLIEASRPDLILFQAGADPYFEDPYSTLALNHNDLLARDRMVFEFAQDRGIPIAWVLAGGYTADVSKVVQVHVNTFQAWKEVYGG